MPEKTCEACGDEHPAVRIWETDSLLCMPCGRDWLVAPEKPQMAQAFLDNDHDVIPLLFRSFADRQWKQLPLLTRARRWWRAVTS